MNSWSRNSRTRGYTTRYSSARRLIDEVVGLSAKMGESDVAVSVLGSIIHFAADGDDSVAVALANSRHKHVRDAVRLFDMGGVMVDWRGFSRMRRNFFNGLLEYTQHLQAGGSQPGLAEEARAYILAADAWVAAALRSAAKRHGEQGSDYLEGASSYFARAFASAKKFVKSKMPDADVPWKQTEAVAAELAGQDPGEASASPKEMNIYSPLLQAFKAGMKTGITRTEGDIPDELSTAVSASEVKSQVEDDLVRAFSSTFGPGTQAFGQYANRFDPKNVARENNKFADFGQAAGAAAMAAALHRAADQAKDEAVKKAGADSAEKINETHWDSMKNSIAAVMGDRFIAAVERHLSDAYPSDASSRRAAKSNLKMTRAESVAVLRQFYDAVRQFFLSELAPQGTTYVQQMFQRFPGADSPFYYSLEWMVEKHTEVQKKPEKTSGDIAFLKLYANKGLAWESRKAYQAVGGEADALKQFWVQKQFGRTADDPDAREHSRLDRSEAVGNVVRGLLALVRQGATGEALGEEHIYGGSSLEIRRLAAQLPPIPQPPASVTQQENATVEPEEADSGDEAPGRQPGEQGDRPQVVSAGAGTNALARAAQIFKDLSEGISVADEQEERIQLTREQ